VLSARACTIKPAAIAASTSIRDFFILVFSVSKLLPPAQLALLRREPRPSSPSMFAHP
jgi:hypothetical protein